MIFKKIHFPIFYFLLFGILFSCEKKETTEQKKKYTTFRKKGDSFYTTLQLDSAFYYYNLAKNIYPDVNEENRAYIDLQIALIQQYNGDLFGCEETVTEVLAYYKGVTYKPYLYNVLAISYDKQKNFDSALEYYKKAALTFSTDLEKATAQNNIGLIYLEKNDYKKSNQILKPLLKNSVLIADKTQYARVLDNLGYSQYKSNIAEGITNLLKSIQIRNSLQDHIGLIASNIHLSEYYRNSNKDLAQK